MTKILIIGLMVLLLGACSNTGVRTIIVEQAVVTVTAELCVGDLKL